MFRLGLSALIVSLLVIPSTVYGEDAKELKIIATAKENTRDSRIGIVIIKLKGLASIRSAEELVASTIAPENAKDPSVQKTMTAELAKLLKVENIDWSKQMVLVGVADDFVSLKVNGKELTATYARYIERPARAVLPFPKVAILTERFEGEIKFVPKEDPKKE